MKVSLAARVRVCTLLLFQLIAVVAPYDEIHDCPEVPLKLPEYGELKEVPAVPAVPAVPEEPLDPDAPVFPEVPLVPDVPVEPLVPDEPDAPVFPEVPDVPAVPEEPEEPLVPDVPEEPAAPAPPDVPEVPVEVLLQFKFPEPLVAKTCPDVPSELGKVYEGNAVVPSELKFQLLLLALSSTWESTPAT